LPSRIRSPAGAVPERRNASHRPRRSRARQRLASSLRGGMASGIRKTGKPDPEKQISCRMETLTSPPCRIFCILYPYLSDRISFSLRLFPERRPSPERRNRYNILLLFFSPYVPGPGRNPQAVYDTAGSVSLPLPGG